MPQDNIETKLTLHQSDILPQSYRPLNASKGILTYIFIYIYVIGYRSAQFMRRALHLRECGRWQFPTRENPVLPIFVKHLALMMTLNVRDFFLYYDHFILIL